MTEAIRLAPGWPGIEPRWTTSAKSAVGTAMGEASRVWFTASHGILNEIYYPEVDTACIRDAGFVVTAEGFLSEVKRHATSAVEWLRPETFVTRSRIGAVPHRCPYGTSSAFSLTPIARPP